ncbi:porin family protein [Sulfurovum mangrovi]|uniref:porin family protein n=1 Tax=Sulfurovum mangrovi TaxID=2893889 RepID=UPI001E2B2EC8|nr:porin family protein [Sulfurovum mangrovi]UFH58972.1 porin family protein [Sulfurovum mangrovi]
MKKTSLSIMACVALSTFSFAGGDIEPVVAPVEEVVAPAPDGSGPYIGAGVSFFTFENKYSGSAPGDLEPIWITNEASWTGGTILAGYQFNPYIAVEGRYSMSFTDASWEVDGSDAGDSNDDFSNLAIYLKPMYPVGDLTLYGLLGYGQTTIDWDGGYESSDSDFQWGIGAGYKITESLSLFVDYTVMFDDDEFDPPSEGDMVMVVGQSKDYKADAITLGITYNF